MNESSVSAHVHAGPRPTTGQRIVRMCHGSHTPGTFNTGAFADEAHALTAHGMLAEAQYQLIRKPFLLEGKWQVQYR